MMQPASVQAVCQQVYARFPNLRGVQPKVKPQGLPVGTAPAQSRYSLLFETQAPAANDKLMRFSVRVVADAQGKILKMTTSR